MHGYNVCRLYIPRCFSNINTLHSTLLQFFTCVYCVVALHSVFIPQDTCDLDARTYIKSTPLLLACKEGNTRCLESLVGYGADLSISDERDGTPLHFILAKSSMKPLSEWTPHLNKVDSLTHSLTHLIHNFVHVSQFHEEYVSGADNSIQDVPVYITVACFLVSEGASLEARSFEGFSPLDLCLTQHRPLLQLFARPERYLYTYRHSR